MIILIIVLKPSVTLPLCTQIDPGYSELAEIFQLQLLYKFVDGDAGDTPDDAVKTVHHSNKPIHSDLA